MMAQYYVPSTENLSSLCWGAAERAAVLVEFATGWAQNLAKPHEPGLFSPKLSKSFQSLVVPISLVGSLKLYGAFRSEPTNMMALVVNGKPM